MTNTNQSPIISALIPLFGTGFSFIVLGGVAAAMAVAQPAMALM